MTDPSHDDGWIAEADRRIARHRMGDCRLVLQDAAGRPLSGPVHVELVRHGFLFGTCVNGRLFGQGPDAERYRAWVLRNCTVLVSENAFKWYSLEKEDDVFAPQEADRQLAWADEHGLAMRGHCLLWSKRKFVQQWAQDLPEAEFWPRIEAHLRRTLAHFAGRVICWDSVNEMLDGDIFPERLGPDAYLRLHRLMNEIAPDAALFPNEYSIIDNDEKSDRYLALIRELQAGGVRFAGIGVQEHAAERFERAPPQAEPGDDRPERQRTNPLIPREVWARLDKLAATGLPIHLTEISFRSFDEQRKAEALEDFYRTAFAHPAVEAILLWGFWERAHWLGRHACLLDKDWNSLPANDTLERLLHQDWHTAVDLQTDAAGEATFRGFYGRYRLRSAAGEAEFDLVQGDEGEVVVRVP